MTGFERLGVILRPTGEGEAKFNADEDYSRRLGLYHDMGLNLFRINACQFLEKQWFYDLCDEMGMMVWPEFPLTSEMKAIKDRFPGCGGVLMWSGHDTFPLTIITSLIDFDGCLKPAAREVSRIRRESPKSAPGSAI